ncbi:MAG: molybdopterin converting factor, large subunit [Halorubrum sp. J07HR59]|nr:MAG: molybdopterin converting factor, large subunit [Halorubrum sp. J07HR59]
MQPVSFVGAGASDTVDRLATDLEGSVAILERGPVDTVRPSDPVARYTLNPDGQWLGGGRDRDLDDFLETLAPEVDYLLIAGDSRLRVPTVLLDENQSAHDVPGDVIYTPEFGTESGSGSEPTTQSPSNQRSQVDLETLMDRLEEAEPYVTLPELVERAKRSPQAELSGALATFTGRVRARDEPGDDRTTHLAFEKYETVAAQRLSAIETELEERDGVLEVLTHHRTGVIADGEDIVYVVVLGGHRTEAFRAVEDGINRLKDEVPILQKRNDDRRGILASRAKPMRQTGLLAERRDE